MSNLLFHHKDQLTLVDVSRRHVSLVACSTYIIVPKILLNVFQKFPDSGEQLLCHTTFLANTGTTPELNVLDVKSLGQGKPLGGCRDSEDQIGKLHRAVLTKIWARIGKKSVGSCPFFPPKQGKPFGWTHVSSLGASPSTMISCEIQVLNLN